MAAWIFAVAAALLASAVTAQRPVTFRGTCAPSCNYLYNNVSCSNDTRCEWWANSNQCQDVCPQLSTRGACLRRRWCTWNWGTSACERACGTIPTSNCSAYSSCVLSRDGNACMPKCSSLGSSSSCLTFFPTCAWNSTNSSCLPGCGVFTSTTTCGNAPGCVWLNALGNCVPQCSTSTNDKDACGAAPMDHCVWKNGMCMEKCAFRYQTADKCTGSDCEVHPLRAPFACQDNCSSLGLNETACNNMTRCYWDEKNTLCRRACNETTDQATCGTLKHCDWTAELGCVQKCNMSNTDATYDAKYCLLKPWCFFDAVLGGCALKCRPVYFSTVQATFVSQCAGDSARCIVAGGDICREKCTRLGADPCRAQERCFWNGNSSMCEERCDAQTSSSSCTGSCLWYSGRNVCRENCSVFSYNETECTSATVTHCLYLGARSKCAPICSMNNCADEHCFTRNGACLVNCSYLNMAQCSMVPRCFWSSESQCKEACRTRYANSVDCNNDGACEWMAGANMCGERCSRWSSNSTQCDMMPQCTYNYTGSVCATLCVSKLSGGSDCDARSNCSTVTPFNKCFDKCAAFNQTSCGFGNNMHCRWNASTTMCELACRARYDHTNLTLAQISCDADAACEWRQGMCGQRCAVATTAANCSAVAPECMWVNQSGSGVCKSPCGLRGSVASCERTSDCQYFEQSMTCRDACTSLPNASLCWDAFPLCAWRGVLGVCDSNCPSRYRSISRCAADSRCEQNQGKCANRCDQLSNVQCNAAANCMWKSDSNAVSVWNSNGKCVADCRSRTNSSECASDDQCSLFNSTMCVPKCASFTDAVTCGFQGRSGDFAVPPCWWNARTESCELHCGMRTGYQVLLADKQGNCTADSGCRWVSGACEPGCPSLGYTNGDTNAMYKYYYPSGAPKCPFNSGCVRATTSALVDTTLSSQYVSCARTTCSSYSTSASCGLESGCTWVDTTKCMLNCSIYPAKVCPTDQGCDLTDATAPTCRIACSSRYTTQIPCDADTNCFWDTVGTPQCRVKCAMLSNNTCKGHCSWSPSAGACTLACSRLTQAVCKTTAGCFYNVINSACAAECSGVKSQTVCLGRSTDCLWDWSGKCRARCSSRYTQDLTITDAAARLTAYKTACSSDAEGCMWRNNGGTYQCVESCGARNMTQCFTASTNCEWNYMTQACVPKCGYLYSGVSGTPVSDCMADNGCRLLSGNSCDNVCDILSVNTTCPASRSCFYDFNQTKCITTCSDRVNCSASWECTKVGSNCLSACSTWGNNSALCPIGRCLFSNTSNTCNAGCSDFGFNETGCNATSGCQYIRNIGCRIRCDSITVRSVCQFSGLGHCYWNPVRNVCRPYCARHDNFWTDVAKRQCDSDSQCEWMWNRFTLIANTAGTCVERCYLLDKATCTQSGMSSVCAWDDRTMQCRRRCNYKYFSKTDCNADAACDWANGANECWDKCSLMGVASCNAASHCAYADNAGICVNLCGTRYKNWTSTVADTYQTDCTNDNDCWLLDGKCYNKCATLARRQCGRTNGMCTWNDMTGKCVTSCHLKALPAYLGATGTAAAYNTTCAADADGMCAVGYRGVGSYMCDPICSFLVTPESCRTELACVWYDQGKRCARTCSTRYDTTEKCDAANDQDCRAGCRERCDFQSTQFSCSNTSNCMWFNSTCVPTCSSYTARADCLASTSSCDWDDFAGSCVNECAAQMNKDDCNVRGYGCVWTENPARCLKNSCSGFGKADACLADGVSCDWVGSVCRPRCARCNVSSDCIAAFNCAWSSNRSLCYTSCGNRRSSDDRIGCASDAHCMWFGSLRVANPGNCAMKCDYLNQADCGLRSSDCSWDNNNMICNPRCSSLYTTLDECVVSPSCQYLNRTGSCAARCSFFGNEGSCLLSTGCMWVESTGRCETKCDERGFNESACNNNTNCWWSATDKTCVRRCNTTSRVSTCRSTNNCQYDIFNDTAKFSLRTGRINTTSFKTQFARLFGTYEDNVTVSVAGTGCNTSVVDVTVNYTAAVVESAISSGVLYSAAPGALGADVMQFGEQGSIPASSAPGMMAAAAVAAAALVMLA